MQQSNGFPSPGCGDSALFSQLSRSPTSWLAEAKDEDEGSNVAERDVLAGNKTSKGFDSAW